MAGQTSNFCGNALCYWDPDVQPQYNVTSRSWQFVYQNIINGTEYYCNILWRCGSSTASVGESTYEDNYMTMVISSKYACANECYFVSNDGEYSIDLLPLAGQNIYGLSSDLSFSIEYSVCRNNIDCGDDEVMAMKWDTVKRECAENLGEFDGNDYNDYNLTYETFGDEQIRWRFMYDNGGLCENGIDNDILNIYYQCNLNVSEWKVINVMQENECEYSIYVDTMHVCMS